jgi:hypothetical protein
MSKVFCQDEFCSQSRIEWLEDCLCSAPDYVAALSLHLVVVDWRMRNTIIGPDLAHEFLQHL